MALPTSILRGTPGRLQEAGITLEMYPSTNHQLTVELQQATANSTASSIWTSVILGPSSARALRYTAKNPDSTRTLYFRARHPAQAGFSAGIFTPIVSAQPILLPDAAPRIPFALTHQGLSGGFNPQGSVLPFVSPNAGLFFNYQQGGPGAGQKWISFGWSAQTLYRPDGTSLTVPVAPTEPNLPTLSSVVGGALGARTRWAKVAYLQTDPVTGLETLYPVSANNSFAVPANELLKVTAPVTDTRFDGWAVLVGSASGSEYVQSVTAKIAFGTDWTEPVGGFSTTQNSLWAGAWQKLTKIGLAVSTQYWHYPYYKIAMNLVLVPAAATNKNPQLAALQNGDGALSLGQYDAVAGYSGAISISTSAAAGTSSGNVGGGRLT